MPQRYLQPWWIYDYTFYGISLENINLFYEDSMQFGHALDQILRETLLSDPALSTLYLLKVDISDVFYRIDLNINDIPNLAVVFPTGPGQKLLSYSPLQPKQLTISPIKNTRSPSCPALSSPQRQVVTSASAQCRHTPPPYKCCAILTTQQGHKFAFILNDRLRWCLCQKLHCTCSRQRLVKACP